MSLRGGGCPGSGADRKGSVLPTKAAATSSECAAQPPRGGARSQDRGRGSRRCACRTRHDGCGRARPRSRSHPASPERSPSPRRNAPTCGSAMRSGSRRSCSSEPAQRRVSRRATGRGEEVGAGNRLSGAAVGSGKNFGAAVFASSLRRTGSRRAVCKGLGWSRRSRLADGDQRYGQATRAPRWAGYSSDGRRREWLEIKCGSCTTVVGEWPRSGPALLQPGSR